MYDDNNVFAKILKDAIPCKKVYEDDFALSFYDAFPKAQTHVLVIPKGPYISYCHFLENAQEEDILGFYKALKKTVDILNLKGSGFRLISNSGINGSQEVPHFHVHILGGEKLKPMI